MILRSRSSVIHDLKSLDTEEFVEGRARVLLPLQTESASGVFFNPKMNLNRDLAILFVSSHFSSSGQLRVCDPMTASGVRAIRYALETPNVLSVLAADNEHRTIEFARATVRLNELETRIDVVESEANLLLLNHVAERFSVIDLDPFGSPAPFFENALRATLDGGVIAATATDMGPLTGARASACIRKYAARPIRSEFEKEMAVRILAACMCISAGRLELGIGIAFSHATDHYARIYAKIAKGRGPANLSTESLGFLEYCPKCLRRNTYDKLESMSTSCEDCGGKTRIGGPIWLGPLWDEPTVQAMMEHVPMLLSTRLSEIQNILACIDQEQNCSPFYCTTDAFSRRLDMKPPALGRVLDALRQTGFEASRTHFSPTGFRTNATSPEIASLFQALADQA
jgi:tRNA (guanine26-N2/guanine27-N2)-dimethyltransferase